MNKASEHAAGSTVWPCGDPHLQGEAVEWPSEGYAACTDLPLHQLHIPANPGRPWILHAEVRPTNWLPDFVSPFGKTDDSGSKIADATTLDDIVSVLAERRFVRAAKRIVALSELHDRDPDEPEVDLESLRRLATTMVANSAWGEPRLTLNDKGYMHAEWSTVENGRIAMTFFPSDLVDFAAISAPVKSGAKILRIGGRHLGEEAINAVRWFAARIAIR